MQKTILIINDNLPEQINGVNTTYHNIEPYAIADGYNIVTINPESFTYFNCPKYNEIKLSIPIRLGKKIKEINPDYIHIATEGPLGLSAKMYLDRKKIPYTTAYHTKFPEAIDKLLHVPEKHTWKLIRWFHKKSKTVLTTTDRMVEQLTSNGFKSKIVPWTRGVDRDIFNPARRTRTNEDDRKYLVCISRISKEKNLEDFLNMDYPKSRKIMVGDGPMRKIYEKKYPDVEFVGFKTGIELAEYYANADVFVFPSQWETFGLVMIEAIACGTPVAAYRCQGPLDIIDDGITGYMDEYLPNAVHRCIGLSRDKVYEGSQRWTWDSAWQIFKNNMVEATQ